MTIYGRWIGNAALVAGTASDLMQPDDASFAYLESHLVSEGTPTYTFTAPQAGWYRFHIVANGGAGGEIGGTASNDRGECRIPPSGAGGGSGGYAIHVVYLEQNDTASFEMTADGISATIAGLLVQVTSGAAGTAATETDPGVGGAGGTASGSNTLNLPGVAGTDGNPEMTGTIVLGGIAAQQTVTFAGPDGGKGGRVTDYRYLREENGTLSTALGAGADGAGGWTAWGMTEEGGTQNFGLSEKPVPKAGSTGGVVVEVAEP